MRGWSPQLRIGVGVAGLLPAHAGIVPSTPSSCRRGWLAPRTRGDGPPVEYCFRNVGACSPRTRRWSRVPGRRELPAQLLPTHAGMAPCSASGRSPRRSTPRACGDGLVDQGGADLVTCSPPARTRGWPRVRPAHALQPQLLPAHAGMFPTPKTRWLMGSSAPRARGDGPYPATLRTRAIHCFSRTQGWPWVARALPRGRVLPPARAGMVPRSRETWGSGWPAPRARGNGPHLTAQQLARREPARRGTYGWRGAVVRTSARATPGHRVPVHGAVRSPILGLRSSARAGPLARQLSSSPDDGAARSGRLVVNAGFNEGDEKGDDGAIELQVSESAPRACGDSPRTRTAGTSPPNSSISPRR
ncbi:hypothetical protein C3489_36500 [Streptomyces sp. Ru71]|nr:hypothetical protein C3489_36500 [Streptomyces sp. Ru71]